MLQATYLSPLMLCNLITLSLNPQTQKPPLLSDEALGAVRSIAELGVATWNAGIVTIRDHLSGQR